MISISFHANQRTENNKLPNDNSYPYRLTFTHINMNIEDFQTTRGSGNQSSVVFQKCFSLVYRLKENILR